MIEPVLAAWRFERRGRALDFGRAPEHDLREIMNAILYVDRTGVRWRYLPHHFPHWNTVYGYFAKWRQEGVFAQLDGLIRRLLRPMGGPSKSPFARGGQVGQSLGGAVVPSGRGKPATAACRP